MKKALVLCLMICVSVIPALSKSATIVQEQSTKELEKQAALREKIELMGLGAQINVEMRGSSASVKYEGTIDEITPESFKLKMRDQILPIRYDQVKTLTLKQRRYKAQEQPDPARVRQVVADMGAGERAKIKLFSGVRLSGTIQSIEKETFVITSNGRSLPIKYGEVTEIERKRFPAWAKVAIVGGVIFGLLFAVFAAPAIS
jgi:ribosome maturation factor RimP